MGKITFRNRVRNRIQCLRYGHFWTEGEIDSRSYCIRCPKSISHARLIRRQVRKLRRQGEREC